MLDFYIIKDDQTKPDYPEQVGLKFAGGLDSKTFDNLQDKKILIRDLIIIQTSDWGLH